jgi:hypothetical protein
MPTFAATEIGQQGHLLAAGGGFGYTLQALYLFFELRDILETAIHGCKSHVCDLVECAQLFHYEFADQSRRDFALPHRPQFVNEATDGLFECVARHRSLLERPHHAVSQFRLVEWLA